MHQQHFAIKHAHIKHALMYENILEYLLMHQEINIDAQKT